MDNDSTYFQLSPCHPHKKIGTQLQFKNSGKINAQKGFLAHHGSIFYTQKAQKDEKAT